ncbi:MULTISPECIES: 30S ribosomal protein S17 [Pyramidobacter]|uniref:Small ribosomal subunit protein uS17 n=2 Tax=Pyramidobacter TaxID=638847 RepID=A0ABM9ZTH1_9BACT|nr:MULTISPECIES: 30S ribosomal protein S17 [Pyramidobacter]EFB90185.1 30S ribosomal protein S17 [Pyramidobacter piscolens W5455]MCI7402735.1 30S ribosomal protein S17 [Pyramidobacter sp.]MDY3213493.1 30S ribosomal protein S17 [Pyramidobacter sp.]MST54808.1 30S ribosomal protein S17 [Pyramidobacter porci]OON89128.1 30S ribosomal protein S17 [Pyramidobacter sp. C12-8]
MEAKTPHRKMKIGIVVSDKMEKTISVRVTRHAMHPVYGKRIIKSKKFLVHDAENACRMGDRVQFAETRPMSKNKRWTLVKIIERAPILGGSVEEDV